MKTLWRSPVRFAMVPIFGGLLLFQNCGGFRAWESSSAKGSSATTLNPGRMLRPIADGEADGTGIYIPQQGTGTNTMLISRYLNGKYGLCEGCPAHLQGLQMSEVGDSLSALSGSSLTQFREIVEMSRFFPMQGKLTNMDDLVAIVQLYQAQGATLMLSMGHPVPSWMNPEFGSGEMSYDASNLCFLPTSDANWNQMKNNMSVAIGAMITALWNDPRLSQTWISEHLLIDPFNEFDSTTGGRDCNARFATGARAAALSGGIQYVLREHHIPVIVTMPSGATGNLQYFSDFYTSGGLGMANVHVYYSGTNGHASDSTDLDDDYIQRLKGFLSDVNQVIPAAFKNNIVLGEFGYLSGAAQMELCAQAGAQRQDCLNRTVSGVAEQQYLLKIFGDPEIKSLAPMRMNWELIDVAANYDDGSPETRFMHGWGVERADTTPKPSLYYYILSHDGINLATDPSRYVNFRARIQQSLTVSGHSSPSSSEVSAFLLDWILEVGTWDKLVAIHTPAANPETAATPKPASVPAALPPNQQQIAAGVITSYYQAYLGREPDAGGLAYYVNQVMGGRLVTEIATELQNSPEARIRQMYLVHLQRNPDSGGMAYWLQSYANGETMIDIESNIRRSPDCRVNCL